MHPNAHALGVGGIFGALRDRCMPAHRPNRTGTRIEASDCDACQFGLGHSSGTGDGGDVGREILSVTASDMRPCGRLTPAGRHIRSSNLEIHRVAEDRDSGRCPSRPKIRKIAVLRRDPCGTAARCSRRCSRNDPSREGGPRGADGVGQDANTQNGAVMSPPPGAEGRSGASRLCRRSNPQGQGFWKKRWRRDCRGDTQPLKPVRRPGPIHMAARLCTES